ncbi:MAG: methyltransferase domain-containing protein [Pseudomonadota bacterium]
MTNANTATTSWDPIGYDRHARFVSTLGTAVLDLLAPKSGERILDLGCGDGVLTERLLACDAEVVGVDGDPRMTEAARARGLDAHLMDGQQLSFTEEFDAVFSNAALHWMRNADAVSNGAYRALRPGGRFVAEFGGHGNVSTIRTALYAVLQRHGVRAENHDPWYFPTPDDHAECLEKAGFRVDTIELIPRPTPLPTGMHGWLETFAQPFLDNVPRDKAESVLDEVVTVLAHTLRDPRGRWTADYCRLRFKATKTV